MDHFHTRTHKLKGNISPDIQENIKYTTQIMQDCNDLVQKQFKIGIDHKISIYIVYMDGLVNTEMLQESVIRPLLQDSFPQERTAIDQYVIESADWKWIDTMEDAMTAVLSGNTILFLGGEARAILFSSKLFPTRGVQNADQEVAIVGPKDSFTESLRMNTALIRRRIRDTRLKVIQKQIGTRSKTDYALMYIEDLVQKDILNKIQKQMDKICVDGIFDKFENPAFDINATKLELYTKVESAVIEYTSKLPEISINVIKGVFSTLWSIVLGFMIGLYLLFDFDNAIKKTISFIPRRICDSLRSVVNKIDMALKNFIQGTLIVSTIIFLVCSVGFWFAGLKAPVFFGLFCAITNIIPYFGGFIVNVLALIIASVISTKLTVLTLIICLVCPQLDSYVIGPRVFGKSNNLHPLVNIFAVFAGGALFGFWGIIVSLPVAITIITTYKYFRHDINNKIDSIKEKI